MGERGGREGMVVASGQRQKKALGELYNPCEIMVDPLGVRSMWQTKATIE